MGIVFDSRRVAVSMTVMSLETLAKLPPRERNVAEHVEQARGLGLQSHGRAHHL